MLLPRGDDTASHPNHNQEIEPVVAIHPPSNVPRLDRVSALLLPRFEHLPKQK